MARAKADKLAKLLSERMEDERSCTCQNGGDVPVQSQRPPSVLGSVSGQEALSPMPRSLPSILEEHKPSILEEHSGGA